MNNGTRDDKREVLCLFFELIFWADFLG